MSSTLTPLASLIRPTTLDDVIGQEHLVGVGKPIRRYIEAGKIPSMIFWWPPGSGKTSLAYIISQSLPWAEFFHLSGVLSKKEDVVKILQKARKNFTAGKQTILFLDEIHRWMKSQQDVLLPFVEKGIVTLIGATTENPSFTINNALISRTRVYTFEKITEEQCVTFLEKNLERIHERYPTIEFHGEWESGYSLEVRDDAYTWKSLWDRDSDIWEAKQKGFYEYRRDLTEYAKENRKNMNDPEKVFWYQILHQEFFQPFHFRRQKPIGEYIVDFYSSRLKLIIEIDGENHLERESYDHTRREYFETLWLREIRFSNHDIMKNTEAVYEKLKYFIESNPPNPPLRGLQEKNLLRRIPEENPLRGLAKEDIFSPDWVSVGITPLSGGDVERSETEGVWKKYTPFSLIAHLGNGDLRNTLNILETACMLAWEWVLTRAIILQAGEQTLLYDRDGEEHYNLISAMHKSLRDSDGDAAIYWIGRMLAGGEDPRYVVRRMINFASEDVFDPQAMILANSVYEICEKMGMPECELPIMNLAYYLADLPKDNRIYSAMKAMQKDIGEYGNLSVPLHLRNAPTALMREAWYGKGYEYAHDLVEKKSSQEHFPEELRGRKYRK